MTTIRFRRMTDNDDDGPKYLSLPRDTPRIYNPEAFFRPESHIAICEGEIDAMTAWQAGIPAVGIAGVSGWQKVFAKCFQGHDKVFILADSDDKGQGMKFSNEVAEQVRNSLVVPMPEGHDVNSFVLENGPLALRERLSLE